MVRRKGHSFDEDFGRQLRLGVVQRGFELFKCVKGEWILEWGIAFVGMEIFWIWSTRRLNLKNSVRWKDHLLDQHPSGYVVRVEESFGKWLSG